MRPRTKNEKFLLLVLLAIVFFAGNFYGYRWLAQRQLTLQKSIAELKSDEAEAKVDLQESDLWTKRQAWIHNNQPTLANEGDAKAEVLEHSLKGARDNKLEIMEQNLNDVEHGAAGTSINVKVKVKGPMEGLCKWLADLQKPEQFYAISSFSLHADQDQKSFICTVQIARYYKDK